MNNPTLATAGVSTDNPFADLVNSARTKQTNRTDAVLTDNPFADLVKSAKFEATTQSGGVAFRVLADAKRMNAGLVQDLDHVAGQLGFSLGVGTAITGHSKMTTSGNVSRHGAGNAVDIDTINGVSYGSDPKQFTALAQSLQKALASAGYTVNSESGNQAAVLFGFNDPKKGGNHLNHVHVSNRGSALTALRNQEQLIRRLEMHGDDAGNARRELARMYAARQAETVSFTADAGGGDVPAKAMTRAEYDALPHAEKDRLRAESLTRSEIRANQAKFGSFLKSFEGDPNNMNVNPHERLSDLESAIQNRKGALGYLDAVLGDDPRYVAQRAAISRHIQELATRRTPDGEPMGFNIGTARAAAQKFGFTAPKTAKEYLARLDRSDKALESTTEAEEDEARARFWQFGHNLTAVPARWLGSHGVIPGIEVPIAGHVAESVTSFFNPVDIGHFAFSAATDPAGTIEGTVDAIAAPLVGEGKHLDGRPVTWEDRIDSAVLLIGTGMGAAEGLARKGVLAKAQSVLAKANPAAIEAAMARTAYLRRSLTEQNARVYGARTEGSAPTGGFLEAAGAVEGGGARLTTGGGRAATDVGARRFGWKQGDPLYFDESAGTYRIPKNADEAAKARVAWHWRLRQKGLLSEVQSQIDATQTASGQLGQRTAMKGRVRGLQELAAELQKGLDDDGTPHPGVVEELTSGRRMDPASLRLGVADTSAYDPTLRPESSSTIGGEGETASGMATDSRGVGTDQGGTVGSVLADWRRSFYGGHGGQGDGAPPAAYTEGGNPRLGSQLVGAPIVRTYIIHPDVAKAWSKSVAHDGSPAIHVPDGIIELDASRGGAETFHRLAADATSSHPHGASVDVYDPSGYVGKRLFATNDGLAGFALDGDNIVSVFKHPNAPRGIAPSLLQLAIEQGGRRLDAFDTNLPHLYGDAGFRVVARLPWDDAHAPANWDAARYQKYNGGKPDVVFMVYDRESPSYRPGDGVRVKTYAEGVAAQRAALRNPTMRLYHGTTHAGAEGIARDGFKIGGGESPYMGDAWIHGVYLSPSLEHFGHEGALAGADRVVPVDANLGKILEIDGDGWKELETKYGSPGDIARGLRREGYDSVKLKAGKGSPDEYIVLDPNRLKVAGDAIDPYADTVDGQAKPDAATTTSAAGGDGTALQQKVIRAVRRQSGLSDLDHPASTTMADAAKGAVAKRYHEPDVAVRIANEVNGGKRAHLDHEQTVGLAAALDDLSARHGDVLAEIERKVDAGDSAELEIGEAAEIADKINRITEAGNKAGTEWGRSGVARQAMMKRDGSFAGIVARRSKLVEGRPLTDKEIAQARVDAEELGQASREAEQQQAKVDDATAKATAKAALAKQSKRQIRKPTAEQRAKIDAKIKDVSERLKTKWKESKPEPGIGGSLFGADIAAAQLARIAKIAPEIIELSKLHVQKGAIGLAENAKAVAEHLKGIGIHVTDNEVAAVLAGKAKDRAGKAQRALTDFERLKSEARSAFQAADMERTKQIRLLAQEAREAATKEARAKKESERNRLRDEQDKARKAEAAYWKDVRDQQRAWEKEERYQRRLDRQEYERFWKASIPGQREALFGRIERMRAKLDVYANEGFLPGRKSKLPTPDDALLREYRIREAALKNRIYKADQTMRAQAESDAMSPMGRVWHKYNPLSVTRSIVASFDVSFPFNQGAMALWSDPTAWARGTSASLRSLSAKQADQILNEMRADKEWFERAQASGLFEGRDIEDIFGAELNIPGVKQTQRAYDVGAQAMRFELFKRWSAMAEGSGRPLSLEDYRQLASNVKTWTGQGEWGKGATAISKPFFALRYRLSQFEVALGAPLIRSFKYAKTSGNWAPFKVMLSKYAQAYGMMAATITAAKVSLSKAFPDHEWDIELDPRNTNFGRLVHKADGGTIQTWDVLPPAMRFYGLATKVATGERVVLSGEARTGEDTKVIGEWFTNGLNPILSQAYGWTRSRFTPDQKYYGKSYDMTTWEGWGNAGKGLLPITIQQGLDLWTNDDLSREEKVVATGLLPFIQQNISRPR